MYSSQTLSRRIVLLVILGGWAGATKSLAQTCTAPAFRDGSFRASGGVEPRDLVVEDFNHDGYPDLAALQFASKTVTSLSGPGVAVVDSISFRPRRT